MGGRMVNYGAGARSFSEELKSDGKSKEVGEKLVASTVEEVNVFCPGSVSWQEQRCSDGA